MLRDRRDMSSLSVARASTLSPKTAASTRGADLARVGAQRRGRPRPPPGGASPWLRAAGPMNAIKRSE